MEALFLLIPLSLLGVGVAVWFFLRMNASGQFEDTEGPAWRVLMDDDRAAPVSEPVEATDCSAFDLDQSKRDPHA